MPSFRSLLRLRRCAPALLLAVSVSLIACIAHAADDSSEAIPTPPDAAGDFAPGEVASRPTSDDPDSLPEDVVRIDQPLGIPLPDANDWSWRWLPTGLIYHSYMAGEHEPRMSLFTFSDLDGRSLWDATLGGRVGILQYGNGDPVDPVGYQLDIYGAAMRPPRCRSRPRLGSHRLRIRLPDHVRRRAVAVEGRLRAPQCAPGR